MKPVLVLASASPARRATLRAAGIDAVVQPSDVDEDAEVSGAGLTDPGEVALLLARRKAESVAVALDAARNRASPDDGSARPRLVVGCDSVLDLDGEALGKPADGVDARRRWRAMRGRSGVLRTGHWVIGASRAVGAVASTVVHFSDIGDDEIDAYVATGEPLGVAGAFTLDGLGGAFVTGVEGDHHNVVGISLPLLRSLFRDVGISWTDLWRPELLAAGTPEG